MNVHFERGVWGGRVWRARHEGPRRLSKTGAGEVDSQAWRYRVEHRCWTREWVYDWESERWIPV